MDLEVAMISAKGGDAAGLVKAMNEGGGNQALLAVPGCRSVKVLPGIENPDNVLFLVEWDSIEAHQAGKTSPGFAEFIKIASPWFGGEGGGSVQHFRIG